MSHAPSRPTVVLPALLSSRFTVLLLPALVLLVGACGEKIVYRDRDAVFEDPPAGAADFLGYSDAETRRTVCGNCHSGKQAVWGQTAHAGAWQTLAASTAARPECEACHAVSARGNAVDQENVGWVATKNKRYQDVQCESCHGPGLTHVLNPDAVATKPLAALAVGTTLTRGCGECHSGAHQPFAEEWTASRHALPPGTRGSNTACNGCHEAKAVLQAWGVRSTFLEEGPAGEHLAITCGVCHDPHDKRHQGQLRFAMDVPSLEANLCMKCHYKRAQPEHSNREPHSPQGPMLLGEAGWVPPNFTYPAKSLVGSHGSDRNPRLCATCHVNKYTVTDKVTGGFTFRATGHSFQAIPCVDAVGLPLSPQPKEGCSLDQRSFSSCTSCHLSETAARSALTVARERLTRLAGEIQVLLAKAPATETNTGDNRISTAEGARFNMQLALQAGSAAHNPFLAEALLLASIRQMELDYGVTVSAAALMEPMLAP